MLTRRQREIEIEWGMGEAAGASSYMPAATGLRSPARAAYLQDTVVIGFLGPRSLPADVSAETS